MKPTKTAKYIYPGGALGREMACGAFVLAAAAAMCLLLPFGGLLWMGTAATACGSLCYVLAIAIRASASWELSELGLTQRADTIPSKWIGTLWSQDVRWQDLTGLRLRYFSTRRDHANGWFELMVTDGKGKITLQDSLDGFELVLDAARRAAESNELDLSNATKANLARLGPSAGAAPGSAAFAIRRVP